MANEPVLTLVGNLTADPELRFTGNGAAVANFTVASTPRTFDRTTNEWVDGDPLFIRCSVWRDYAENVTESLAKGMRVVVHGRLQVRSYQRNDGSQGTSVEMQVDEVGPSLMFATAQVTKSAPNSSPHAPHTASNQNYGQGHQQQNSGAQNDAQGFNAPPQNDQWTSQTVPF